MASELFDFVLVSINNEWEQFFGDLVGFAPDALLWQPAPRLHSAGWHLRHLVEWRYAAIHVMICGQPNLERLYCLGSENDNEVRRLAANPGEWFEPRFSTDELRLFAQGVRHITEADIRALPHERYFETRQFPWGQNTLLNEIMEEGVRHSALHRGQARELRKLWQASEAH